MMKYFSIFYYTVPIQILATFAFILNGLFNYRKINGYRSLLLYGTVSLAQSCLSIYISVFTDHDPAKTRLIINSINVFMLFEWIMFYRFIMSLINSPVSKLILQIIFVAFIIVVLCHWLFTDAFNKTPTRLTVLESYLLISGCLLYYLEVFSAPPTIRLLRHPPFWAITGILLLFSFLLPVFLQYNMKSFHFNDLYNTIYMINFIGYTVLFIFFNIALRCQIKKLI